MKKIIVLGPNPAWQKTLFFECFRYGEINRAAEMQSFPAGKGINFCRAARIHGAADARLIQFAGGDNGSYVRAALEKEGMNVWNVETTAATRCCTTCLCRTTQTMTEIIEPSFAATTQETGRMLEYFEAGLKDADGAAFCGTLPSGTDPLLYARAARLAARANVPVLVDSFRDIQPVFDTGVKIYLKINADELRAMTGKESVADGLRQVFTNASVLAAAITDGPSDAYAGDGKAFHTYRLPRLEKIVNPIGCGDTASAVWMSEILSGRDFGDAFRLALGAASANCLTAFPGSFDPAEAERLADGIVRL